MSIAAYAKEPVINFIQPHKKYSVAIFATARPDKGSSQRRAAHNEHVTCTMCHLNDRNFAF